MREKMRIVLEMHRGVWRRKQYPVERFIQLWTKAAEKSPAAIFPSNSVVEKK